MKILNLVPVVGDIWTDEMGEYITKYLMKDTEMVTWKLDYGPATIEGEYDEVMCAPDIVFKCIQAEKEGFDAIFIDCFGDPAVRAAREAVNIPVFGGFEPSIYYALGVADKIGIVTVLPEVVPLLNGLIAKAGLQYRVPSVRYVNIPVHELHSLDNMVTALIDECLKAAKEDGVGAIVLGCTAFVDVKEAVEAAFEKAGYKIPVIEAAQSAVMLLETYVRMGLNHSGVNYMPPRTKQRLWWAGKEATEI